MENFVIVPYALLEPCIVRKAERCSLLEKTPLQLQYSSLTVHLSNSAAVIISMFLVSVKVRTSIKDDVFGSTVPQFYFQISGLPGFRRPQREVFVAEVSTRQRL